MRRAQPIPPPMMASAAFCRALLPRPPDAGAARRRGLTADDCAAILATAAIPRRTGRGLESETAAADRGAVDKAIVAGLFQGGLRRSEAAALTWGDVQDATDGRGILVHIRRSKTDQDGTAADVRYLKNGCAVALRQLRDRRTVQRSGLRPEPTDQVLGGLNGQSIARRLTAAVKAAGIEGRITGHSGRVVLASELTARGASTTETMLAGGWKTARMVAHYAAGATAELGAAAPAELSAELSRVLPPASTQSESTESSWSNPGGILEDGPLVDRPAWG